MDEKKGHTLYFHSSLSHGEKAAMKENYNISDDVRKSALQETWKIPFFISISANTKKVPKCTFFKYCFSQPPQGTYLIQLNMK